MDRQRVEDLLLEIMYLEEFESVRYYAYNLAKPMWNIFKLEWKSIPYFLRVICEKSRQLIKNNEVELGDILKLYSEDPCYLWVASNINTVKPQTNLSEMEIIGKLMDGEDVSEYVDVEEEKLICSLVCYTIDNNPLRSLNFNEICKSEVFKYSTTDYNLTNVDTVEFLSSGYVYDNKYYLYNRCINKEKIQLYDKKPAIFRIIEEEILNPDIYLRLDDRLASPSADAISLETIGFDRFRGIQFKFSKTILNDIKNIIVHQDIKSLDKLLMVVKKDFDTELNEEFWHVEIEELPYIEESYSKKITTTFIHGQYYPKIKYFRHIDFTQNQYALEVYLEKYVDTSNTEILIDHYTDKKNHYKIWCVEGANIKEETWYKLVKASLHRDYRELFDEILGNY